MNSIALRQQLEIVDTICHALYLVYCKKTTDYKIVASIYAKAMKELDELEEQLQEHQAKLALERKGAYDASESLRRKYRKSFQHQRQAKPYRYCRKIDIDLIVNEYDALDDNSREYGAFQYRVESPSYSLYKLEETIRKLNYRIKCTKGRLSRLRVTLSERRTAMLIALDCQNSLWHQRTELYQQLIEWYVQDLNISIAEARDICDRISKGCRFGSMSIVSSQHTRGIRSRIPFSIDNTAVHRPLYRGPKVSRYAA